MTPMLLAVLALAAPQDLSAYEGVSRDDFATWSFTSGSIAVEGDARTTSVLTRYVTPDTFGGTTPIAYSIHTIRFHCAERTADWISGINYAAGGAEVRPASPDAGEAWSASTPGFVQLAETVCAMNAPA